MFCIITTQIAFVKVMTWYYVSLGIILALPMLFVGVLSLGEADYNPRSAVGK